MPVVIVSLAWIALVLAGFVGWVFNLIDVIHMLGGPVSAMFIARLVGLFAFPLGAVLGYL